MSLAFLQQWLCAATIVTISATLGILPTFLRQSRAGGALLLAFLALTGVLICWWTQNPRLFSVILLPLGVGLAAMRSQRLWKPWACMYAMCFLQNMGIYLIYFADTLVHTSGRPFITGSLIWLMQAVSLAVASPSLFDALNVLGRKATPARDQMLSMAEPSIWPGCCFQIATHNEPPELLEVVIRRLMQQEYPGQWMIQVVDNNTSDPAIWTPIQDLCQQLGEHVQFLHLDPWSGFKAGALNEGMRHLPEWVSLIAVIDADYLVQPDFLCATVRHFADTQVAFVQTPQCYRNGGSEGLRLFYDSAFLFQMASRAEWNALYCSGTMLILRRSSLEDIGYWDERCIMEDLELSLRLLSRGWRGVYDHRVYGTGLMPFDFASLSRQRFRWTFGTLQALKKHWRLLVGFPVPGRFHLTLAQRFCSVGLGCSYLIDGVSFLSALLLLGIAAFSVCGWNLPLPSFTALFPGFLLALNLLRIVWALREVSGRTYVSTISTFLFTQALSWITARACITAIIHQPRVFLRTPKGREIWRWKRVFQSIAQEIFLTLCFVGMACATIVSSQRSVPMLGLLLFQAAIYGIAGVMALTLERHQLAQMRVPEEDATNAERHIQAKATEPAMD